MKEQKFLQRDQLHLVKPKFRKTVEEAWANGEDVPYGYVYLSDREPTKEEIEHAAQLNKLYKWEEI